MMSLPETGRCAVSYALQGGHGTLLHPDITAMFHVVTSICHNCDAEPVSDHAATAICVRDQTPKPHRPSSGGLLPVTSSRPSSSLMRTRKRTIGEHWFPKPLPLLTPCVLPVRPLTLALSPCQCGFPARRKAFCAAHSLAQPTQGLAPLSDPMCFPAGGRHACRWARCHAGGHPRPLRALAHGCHAR